MEYYKLLNLDKEPFSNSPDPDYFFKSRQHTECLQKLELSLRLRRGLNVVIGEVGTGKTTLCRQMIKKFGLDKEFETHLILDPHMTDPAAFLKVVAGMFEREPKVPTGTWADYKEFIKQYLYKRGVEEKRVVVLIIDEGQKIPAPILEILRELLNYETNEYKLLQIVIFAQREFEQILEKQANFADRINLLHVLGPLGFRDTRLMIDYRLQKAGAESRLENLLSFPALVAIYRATGGYPRKIVNLCHRIMLAMIVKDRRKAGWRLVRSCVNRGSAQKSGGWQKAVGFLLVVGAAVGIAYTGFTPEKAIVPDDPVSGKVFPVRSERMPVGPRQSANDGRPPPASAPAGIPDEGQSGAQPGSETVTNSAKGSPTLIKNLADKAAPATENRAVENSAGAKPAAAVSEPGKGHPAIVKHVADKKAPAAEMSLLEGPKDTKPLAAIARAQPQTLGIVRVQAGEILSWLMIKIYGEYRNLTRRALEAANPDLKDPNNIVKGQAIEFPALAYTGPPAPDYLHWIRVGSVETVSEALGIIRRNEIAAAPLRMMPYWHSEQGLRFDIIFKAYFSSSDEADRYLADLPEGLRQKSEIITGWEKGAVFYAVLRPRIKRKGKQ